MIKTKKSPQGKTVLVTGSAGLIGSESVRFFCDKGFKVVGIDNDMRSYFFGKDASTSWNRVLLEEKYKNYRHFNIDIRNTEEVEKVFKKIKPDLIIHTAAQPSHDWAAREPVTDFSVNAMGTLVLLEATRKYVPNAVFIFTSTNKVYGDRPNFLPLIENETRWELPKTHPFYNGIDESMSIDACLHSVFGASKVASDILTQEYGKYFGLKTGIFRGGCITGPAHSGAQLHGFLAYLVKAISQGTIYTIFGYKGKQVRDNIHARDLVAAFYEFYKKPRKGEVYNMGGHRHSHTSIMEVIPKIEKILGKKAKTKYVKKNRVGDHIWYISDVSKFKSHYPKWKHEFNGESIVEELCFYAKKNS